MLTKEEKLELEQVEKELEACKVLEESLKTKEEWADWDYKRMTLAYRCMDLKLKDKDLYEEYTIDNIPMSGIKIDPKFIY